MKFLKELLDEERNGEEIDCFDFNEFSNLEKIDRRSHGTLKKANWENRKITVVLRSSNNSMITESGYKEFITKLKALCKINYLFINRFFGLTRDSSGDYFLISEYSIEGNLRDYLKIKFNKLQWDDKLQVALDITCGLMHIHSKKIIHGNLHPRNVLINNGMIMMMTDFRLLDQVADIISEYTVYVEPQCLRNPSYKLDMKSDIYSLGVLLWELSSGRPPFSEYIQKAFGITQLEYKLLNGEKEKPVIDTPLEYQRLYQKCWQDDPNLRPVINEVYEVLSRLKLQSDKFINKGIYAPLSSSHTAKITSGIFETSQQKIIELFKLNYGITLNGYDILPSLQGVTAEDGELIVNLYEGQPLVYTSINIENNELNRGTCINFPIAEIIYNGELLESFIKYTDNENELHKLHGDFLARRFLVGGKLFIEDFNLATTPQADILKYYLFCIYNSAKYSIEIRYNNLITLDLLPKLVTLDGGKIYTHEELTDWMNNLYQKKMGNIISYDDLIPISRLKSSLDGDHEALKEIQPGVINFKEKLSLDEWVGNAVNNNLISWTRDFNLFQGLIVNKHNGIEVSKKIPVDFIEIPKVKLYNKSYLKIIRPSTKLEFALISNNIFSIKNLSAFPFIQNNDKSYEGYNYVFVECEKFEILFNTDNIKPTIELEQSIDDALNNMKPLKALQDIHDKYGHLFPQKIIFGKSLKNVLRKFSSSDIFDDININDNNILKSLEYLDISYLLTQNGRIIENNDLHNWIINNHMDIIKFDNIIPLYKILKAEQQEKIENILKNNYRIIMTGITDLIELYNKNVENYKRINFGLSLESEDYEVFGSIISKNNVKLEEFYVSFELYDFNGFYTIINKIEETDIDITECYVSWIIIGNPSQLSVFSPSNRELQVDYIKDYIKFQSNKLNYTIDTSITLYEGYTVFVQANHSSINYKSNNIRFVGWQEKSINVQIESIYKIKLNTNSLSLSKSDSTYEDNKLLENGINLHVCILPTNYESLRIDNIGNDKKMNILGYILNKENFNRRFLNETC
ncbi:kinase-like domain-containing protein [Rhizophagus clarus]|uniref:Kinase-like domain-containing protein n=1 Tax=Rhizophagus clarus TaxID=94130 RepID=A0A8H3QHU7_9GLOM|nr:kinase-like domain-containing protein [Rhizophagus clarus]